MKQSYSVLTKGGLSLDEVEEKQYLSVVIVGKYYQYSYETISSAIETLGKAGGGEIVFIGTSRDGDLVERLFFNVHNELENIPILFKFVVLKDGIDLITELFDVIVDQVSSGLFLFLTEGFKLVGVPWEQLVEMFSENPNLVLVSPSFIVRDSFGGKVSVVSSVIRANLKGGILKLFPFESQSYISPTISPVFGVGIYRTSAVSNMLPFISEYNSSEFFFYELGFRFWRTGMIVLRLKEFEMFRREDISPLKVPLTECDNFVDEYKFNVRNVTSKQVKAGRTKTYAVKLLRELLRGNFRFLKCFAKAIASPKTIKNTEDLDFVMNEFDVLSIVNGEVGEWVKR